jgi:hypothetical protein
MTFPQNHVGLKSFSWHGDGSHSKCLNLQLSDSVGLAVRFGIASEVLESNLLSCINPLLQLPLNHHVH